MALYVISNSITVFIVLVLGIIKDCVLICVRC